MASQNPNPKNNSLYPEVIQSNSESSSHVFSNPNPQPSSSTNLYPSIDMRELVENLFPDPVYTHQQNDNAAAPSAPPEESAVEEVLIKIPGAILNLIDKHYSVELASGDLSIIRLRQGHNVVAVLARVADEIQWPLAKDEAAVKLDDSHYFFSLRVPKECHESDSSDEEDNHKKKKKKKKKKKNAKKGKDSRPDSENILNYGLTIASKGQEKLLKEFDEILQTYSLFSVQKVSEKAKELLDESVAKEISPADLKSGKNKEILEEKCIGYWTTLAPNVEDYSGTAAKIIAAGSGQLIKGILWCGDVTVDRLKWGNEVMKKRISPTSKSEISPDTLKRIKRCEDDNCCSFLFLCY